MLCQKPLKNIEALNIHSKNVHSKNKTRNIDEELTEEVLADLEKYNFPRYIEELTAEEEADLEKYNF